MRLAGLIVVYQGAPAACFRSFRRVGDRGLARGNTSPPLCQYPTPGYRSRCLPLRGVDGVYQLPGPVADLCQVLQVPVLLLTGRVELVRVSSYLLQGFRQVCGDEFG